jgi:hypothetical protein
MIGTNLQPEYIDNPYEFYQDYTCSKEKVGKYTLEEGIRDYIKEVNNETG